MVAPCFDRIAKFVIVGRAKDTSTRACTCKAIRPKNEIRPLPVVVLALRQFNCTQSSYTKIPRVFASQYFMGLAIILLCCL
jgi:hypothetical protein